MIKPVVRKYTPGGAGIIFHQMIMFTIAIANATNRKPFKGFCSRIKRRKKMGESHVAQEMIQRPFENNIKTTPMANNK
jgi:hypothetical protein